MELRFTQSTKQSVIRSKMKSSDFIKYIEWLRSDDSPIYEDGFNSITGHVDDVLPELIELALNETDAIMRSKFVELIGESTVPIAIEFLIQELASEHIEIRSWAYSSLANSEDKSANAIAEKFAAEHPDEEYL